MNCPEVQNKLSAFLDQELPIDEYQAIKTHLKQCSLCTSEMLKVQRMKRALRDAFEINAIPPLRAHFVAEEIIKRARKTNTLQNLVWIAAIIVTSLVVLSIFSYFQQENFNAQLAQSLTEIHFGLSTERAEFSVPQSTQGTGRLIVQEIKLVSEGY
ncbi:zf-HC2 domain-containing protein [Thermatribacter velox]|uniref:Zf-HC2 domain-containing protein n=1 Tax=Thermatribacter velox TaxID=3039681 RepID=A0ABZ2YDY8_9BACT